MVKSFEDSLRRYNAKYNDGQIHNISESQHKANEDYSAKVEESSQGDIMNPSYNDGQNIHNISKPQGTTNEDYPAKAGESSHVDIKNPYFAYDGDNVFFSCSRIDNESEAPTGVLWLYVWISKCQFDGNGYIEDPFLVGQIRLGPLDVGYGFPDVKVNFEINKNAQKIINQRNFLHENWYFVFIIKESHEDGKRYIIDYVNSTNMVDFSLKKTDNSYRRSFNNFSIEDRVRYIITKKLGVDFNEVVNNARFEDLGVDSLNCVELTMELEAEFGISIPDEDALKIRTVGEAINYIQRHC